MIATNSYGWSQLATEAGLDWPAATDWAAAQAARAGLSAWEPIVTSPEAARDNARIARDHGLVMPSFYMGAVLHDDTGLDAELDRLCAIAASAATEGAQRAVVNPNPITWGGAEDKDDEALIRQAQALDRLGGRLADLGVTLCYHTHDAEMRASAREFHHMMLATDPARVRLCLDPHWIWRGAGNSSVALFDIIHLYGARTEIIHLRQSRGGIWQDEVADGDLDYPRIARALSDAGSTPQLTLEIALEEGTPRGADPAERHRASIDYIARLFGQSATEGGH